MAAQQPQPIFVVGCPRSGTTLLYSILLTSGEFPIYEAESRILECSSRYGRLARRANLRRLLEDFCNSRQFARSGLDRDTFREETLASCRTYPELLRFFMGEIAKLQGKQRWVEKTPNHVFYMSELAGAFPACRFIHVVRDARDVALSWRKLSWLDRHTSDPTLQLVWGARLWEGIVLHARKEGRKLGERYLEVGYESLVTDLASHLDAIGRFADVELSSEAIGNARIGALERANTAFETEERSLSSVPVERWRSMLTDIETEAIEWAVGDTLRHFGYRPSGRGTSENVDLRVRLHSHLARLALTVKRSLNHRTLLGRLASKPLEIGLE